MVICVCATNHLTIVFSFMLGIFVSALWNSEKDVNDLGASVPIQGEVTRSSINDRLC